jgi:hypothetical protein
MGLAQSGQEHFHQNATDEDDVHAAGADDVEEMDDAEGEDGAQGTDATPEQNVPLYLPLIQSE